MISRRRSLTHLPAHLPSWKAEVSYVLDSFQPALVGLLTLGTPQSSVGLGSPFPRFSVVGIQGNGLGELINGLLKPALVKQFNSPGRQVGGSGNGPRHPGSGSGLGRNFSRRWSRRSFLGQNGFRISGRWRLRSFRCCFLSFPLRGRSGGPGIGRRSITRLLGRGLLSRRDRGLFGFFHDFLPVHHNAGQVPSALDTEVQAAGVRRTATGTGSGIFLSIPAKQGTAK